jgi:hypothetical protein
MTYSVANAAMTDIAFVTVALLGGILFGMLVTLSQKVGAGVWISNLELVRRGKLASTMASIADLPEIRKDLVSKWLFKERVQGTLLLLSGAILLSIVVAFLIGGASLERLAIVAIGSAIGVLLAQAIWFLEKAKLQQEQLSDDLIPVEVIESDLLSEVRRAATSLTSAIESIEKSSIDQK